MNSIKRYVRLNIQLPGKSDLKGQQSVNVVFSLFIFTPVAMELYTMRPKARGLAQHGGLPVWLEESDSAGCDFVRDGRSMPSALLAHHTTCPGLGLIYC
jgi:hypothetical protein